MTIKTKNILIDPKNVKLVLTKGTINRGGGAGGESWKIEVNNKRVGVIFINLIDELPIGKHPSIQIFLNKTSQGKGIGRIAYKLACDKSKYDIIYAHMRKSNIASKKAAIAAGFKELKIPKYTQLIMIWKRKRK